MGYMSQNDKKNLILSTLEQEILAIFEFGKFYSMNEIIEPLQEKVSLATIKRHVAHLKELGYITTSGEKRGVRYVLNDYGLIHRPFDPQKYFTQEGNLRGKTIRFRFEILDILENNNLLSEQELLELNHATKTFHERAKGTSETIHQKELERFVIELSWKSSKIEGNTYTILDTERLIRDGIPAEGKTKDETTMILNHKKAFDYILELKQFKKEITVREVENIHRLLITNLGVAHGVRSGGVGITGSDYISLDMKSQIAEQLEKLVHVIGNKSEPFSKALLAVMGISYLQPFEDGNKRTARLLANAFLILENRAPLSYRNVDEKNYRESMLVFYEQNSIEPFKKIFVEQYLFACEHYNIGQ
jgi:Fic family protein